MKNTFTRIALVCALMTLMFSCQKEEKSVAVTDDVETLVVKAGAAWDAQEVYSDDASQSVFMANAGIPADFLVNETYMDDGQGTFGNDPDRIFIRDHSFIRCLRGLEITDEQAPGIRRSLGAYKDCTDHAVQRAREIYRDLKDKYHAKYQRIWNAYQDGTITEREFRQRVGELRESFRAELRRMHLAEKLDAALAQCLRECFRNMKGILTERQWNAFMDCVTG